VKNPTGFWLACQKNVPLFLTGIPAGGGRLLSWGEFVEYTPEEAAELRSSAPVETILGSYVPAEDPEIQGEAQEQAALCKIQEGLFRREMGGEGFEERGPRSGVDTRFIDGPIQLIKLK
jgi:hypothetical protein